MAGNPGDELTRLVEIMARLRGEGGCPWDREQDLRSLRPYLVEEAFEVLDEMDRVSYGGPWRPLAEELGDLLFQIVFHSQLAREKGEFDMADVCRAISDKIVNRHPHVFGEAKVTGSVQVLENWAKLKAEEKRRKSGHEGSVLDGVPTAAPSLVRAERLTEKASRIGFDWPDLKGVKEKLEEELAELDEAIASGDRDHLEHELGDVLFALANLARFIKTPPEDALRQANRRFTARFHQIEAALREAKIPFGQATLEQMDAIWKQAKEREKALPPPRELPRAAVGTIRLGAARFEQTAAFWLRLAEALRWRAAPPHERPLGIDTGAVRIELLPAPSSGGAGLALCFEAPSATAVAALAQRLTDWKVAAHSDGSSVRFADPEGVALEYRVGQ